MSLTKSKSYEIEAVDNGETDETEPLKKLSEDYLNLWAPFDEVEAYFKPA